jgi:catalase (peroxidase I)
VLLTVLHLSPDLILPLLCCAAWYKLMNRDMGPSTRCLGKDVPALHTALVSFELGTPSKAQADFGKVRADIAKALSSKAAAATPDTVNGQTYYGALFSDLAWQCAATFRATDKQGGCNGAITADLHF